VVVEVVMLLEGGDGESYMEEVEKRHQILGHYLVFN
jgi:hypothetical protein